MLSFRFRCEFDCASGNRLPEKMMRSDFSAVEMAGKIAMPVLQRPHAAPHLFQQL
ncbi:MAG: hypothetical protein ABW175_24520 [Bradyrhizobium sp.]